MNKITKLILCIVLGLVIFSASAWAIMILKDPFLREVMGHWIQSLFTSATPDWKTYKSPDGGLSFDSPFPVEWKKDSHVKENGKGFQITTGKSRPNRSGFSVDVNSTWFINLKINPSSGETENLMKENFQANPKFQWKDQAVICSGMPATLAAYSFELNGRLFHFSDLWADFPNRSVKFHTISYQENADTYNEWTKRVIESIKIEEKNP